MAPKTTAEPKPEPEPVADLDEIQCPTSAAGERCEFCDDPDDEEWEHSSARGWQAIDACRRSDNMLHAVYGDLQKVHNRLLGIVDKMQAEEDQAIVHELILLARRCHSRLKDVRQDLKDAIAGPASGS